MLGQEGQSTHQNQMDRHKQRRQNTSRTEIETCCRGLNHREETRPVRSYTTIGSIEAIDEIVKKYGAYYSHIPLENSALAYTVDHTSRAYLIGTEGQLISTVAHGTSVDELVALLKQHL